MIGFMIWVQTIYEPEVPTEKGKLIADWLILPQKGLDKPVIIEYWGLLREDNRATMGRTEVTTLPRKENI